MAKRTKSYQRLLESEQFEAFCAPIKFLEELKASLEHTRRFTVDMQPRPGDPYANKIARTEGEIEEWLLKHGFWESEDYDGEVTSLIGEQG